MGGGGNVNLNNPQSRFKSNGHFGPCAKDWYGWLDEDTQNIIDITM